ncbi:MAG: hypothetical protein LBT99_00750 [Bifidobacteriaceae bacterium]|jgi:hypothetical protein|nr:hypothetical protein [Bifidobacteriaceae bacterium]
MEIRKTNIEIRKNWNKFSFKKLGAVFCLFLFGIVTFISGNLAQVNAATSSTVLPVAKGGTAATSASAARNNLQAEYTGNKITSISSSSNDTQYPSASAIWNYAMPKTTYYGSVTSNYMVLSCNPTNLQTVSIWVRPGSNVIPANTTINFGTLPVGCRPYGSIYIPMYDSHSFRWYISSSSGEVMLINDTNQQFSSNYSRGFSWPASR